MKWRYAIIVLILVLLAAVRVAVGVPQDPPVTYTGQVDIALGTDGKLLILIDEGTPAQPNDGLVEHVFRLQQAPSLAFSGYATVTSIRGRLTVQIGPDSGWIFNVAGRTLPPPDLALTAYDVMGIAHISGPDIHKSPATLFSTLSSGTCAASSLKTQGSLAMDDGAGGCKNCQAGGAGASGCGIDCGDGSTCDADCSAGSFACCSSPWLVRLLQQQGNPGARASLISRDFADSHALRRRRP